MTTRSNSKVYFRMWSYRAHSSVKNLLKFTRKLLWNLLENYLEIYSKITWEFTRKLFGNLLEINCEEIMLWYIHQSSIFAIRQYRTCGPVHVNKWTCGPVHVNKWTCVIFGMNECIVKVIFTSYGHTTLDIPDPIRTPKSSRVGLT